MRKTLVGALVTGCDEYGAAFSPDGSLIAFNTCWCPKVWCRDPAWSPDGSRIVFAASGEQFPPSLTDWDLWLVDADGEHLEELYAGRGGQRHPSWSPDGRPESESFELYKLLSDGSQDPVLVRSPGWGLTWRP